MNDIGTPPVEQSRAVVTESARKDANKAAADRATVQTAMPGQGGGKEVPPASESRNDGRARERDSRTSQAPEKVGRAVTRLNDYVQSIQRDLRFSLDESSGTPVVSVIDRSTEKVIRQIPSDVALRLARNLNENLEQMQQTSSAGYGPAGDPASTGPDLGLVNTTI